jgi:transcriptional repressor NrdR
MRCPWCGQDDDRVVDSRPAEDAASVRRRRECGACGRRFTTFERAEDVRLLVLKRDGATEPFSRDKLGSGIRKAVAGRPVSSYDVEQMLDRIHARLRKRGPQVTTQMIGAEVLTALRKTDEVAYMRFASVHKDFQGVTDFERELGDLQKREAAKLRRRQARD